MTDEEIKVEIESCRQDLEAFIRARDTIQRRILDLESDPVRYNRFITWAGTQVVLNGLIMCIVKCQGMIEDMIGNLSDTKAQVVPFILREVK